MPQIRDCFIKNRRKKALCFGREKYKKKKKGKRQRWIIRRRRVKKIVARKRQSNANDFIKVTSVCIITIKDTLFSLSFYFKL